MIPVELHAYRHWCWSSLVINPTTGKPDKAPRKPDGSLASVADPSSWSSYEEVRAALDSKGGAIGFVLTPSDPYCIIDLDKTDDLKAREGQSLVWEGFAGTYAEYSQSGEGVHIVLRGVIGGGVRRRGLEVYDRGRYMIFTGNVLRDQPVADMGSVVNELVAGLGGVDASGNMPEDMPAESTDQEILDRITRASNAAKFLDLYYTAPGAGDDWSQRDAALAQFIAFYTRNHEQALRLFRGSVLYDPARKAAKSGYKTVDSYEQGYLLGRTFKRQWQELAPQQYHIDKGRDYAETVLSRWREAQAAGIRDAEARVQALSNAVDESAIPSNSIPMPPGLVGSVAAYVYNTSPSPVWEIAVASAITFCSAVFGNKWRTSTGNGLGHYVVLLADSGVGKTAGTSRITALARAVEDKGNALMADLAGPGYLASGQALIKLFAERPVMYSFLAEFGETLKRLDPTNASDSYIEFRRVLLEVFDAERINSAAYAQKKDSTDKVDYPVLSFLGDTRAEDFFSLVTDQFARSGFLARLTLIEYAGKIPERPSNYAPYVPEDLVDAVGAAVFACNRQVSGVHAVPMEPAAALYFDELGRERVFRMNTAADELTRGAWNRLDLRIARLATVLAVGENWVQPVVTLANMKWAEGIVRFGLEYTVGERVSADRMGDGETRFTGDIEEFVNKWRGYTPAQRRASLNAPRALEENPNVFPYPSFKQYVKRRARFVNHKLGFNRAVELALDVALKDGLLDQLTPEQCQQIGYSGRVPVFMLGENWSRPLLPIPQTIAQKEK